MSTEKATKSRTSARIRKWLRIIHRDLGYLMVGISLVYGISGIYLNNMKGKDPAFKSEVRTFNIGKQLSEEQFSSLWGNERKLPALKRVLRKDDNQYNLMLEGGIGTYNKATGEVNYEHHKKRQFVYWINKLHYNKVEGWHFMGDLFAVSLIFFAISGLFMLPGKKGIAGRGKYYLIVGIAIPVIYILLM